MQFIDSFILIALLILLVASLLCGCMHHRTEYFSNNANVFYIDKNTFIDTITLSSFFRNLTPTDLFARGNVSSQSEYAEKYLKSKVEFSDDEKDVLDNCVTQANNMLRDFPKFQQAPWNFAKVQSSIENGYPHTLGTIIVLNDKVLSNPINDLIKTLIHEKIHVAQRTYPIQFMQLYESIGFTKTREITHHALARANPDIDNNLYIYIATRKVPMQLYTSKYPSSIADSVATLVMLDGDTEAATASALGLPENIHCQLEHPNEIVACIMAELITNEDRSFIQRHPVLSTIWTWMMQNWK
jgi:hypothetical protein